MRETDLKQIFVNIHFYLETRLSGSLSYSAFFCVEFIYLTVKNCRKQHQVLLKPIYSLEKRIK